MEAVVALSSSYNAMALQRAYIHTYIRAFIHTHSLTHRHLPTAMLVTHTM